jgi:hypothetical protein
MDLKKEVAARRRDAGKVPNPVIAGALCKALGLEFQTERRHRASFVTLKTHAIPVRVIEPVVDLNEFSAQ